MTCVFFLFFVLFLSPVVWVCIAALAILDRLVVVDLPTPLVRMVASGKTAAQRRHERPTRKARRFVHIVHILIYVFTYLSVAVMAHRALATHLSSIFKLNEFYRSAIVNGSYLLWLLNKLTWIDSAALTRFILSAQVRERMLRRRPFLFLSQE